MLALKQFRDKAKGVPDLLNWAALIDAGIVLGKDGSLLGGWFFRGPDAASMTPGERNYLTGRVNAAVARLGGEWALWIDAVRMPAAAYPDPSASQFPDAISALIDEERRVQFMKESAHFETEHALILMYTPPLRRQTKVIDFIYDDDGDRDAVPPSERQIEGFKRVLSDVEDALSDLLRLRRMGGFDFTDAYGQPHLQDELVNYLHFCLTGDLGGLNIPPCAMYLDAVIGGQELWPGDTPKIGERFVACLAVEGFPHESFPLMLSVLDDVPVAYRFSTRFKPLDAVHAVGELGRYRRKWMQLKRGFWTQIFRTQGGFVNEDAALMAAETESAISEANSALLAFGYYTPVIVLMGPDRQLLTDQARLIARQIRSLGFAARVEMVNTMEAWLGTLPGHVHPNVRRPLIHSLNLADLVPLSAKWPGLDKNPNPLYPPDSPPLMHAATSGATPFRLNLHVSDVGHTLIFGPTGSGKSVLLAMIAAQFRRYAKARITVFDKGRSMFALATACGGAHYDLGGDAASPGLCPLAQLDTDADASWAEDWIATLYELQSGAHPVPRQKQEIHRAISLMRQAEGGGRTLTDFLATVQDTDIRAALSAYTIDGPLGRLLDAREDGLADNSFSVFEVDELMGLRERNLIPVLLYLFRRFERSLDGSPALLLLDEAWIMLGQVLGPRDVYALFGLNDAEVAIIQNAAKKRHYYAISPDGRRQFELGLGPIALAFAGASSKDQIAEVKSFQARHGEAWPFHFLEKNGVRHAPVA